MFGVVGEDWVVIGTGNQGSFCVARNDTETWAWGVGTSGQLGNNALSQQVCSPVSVTGNYSFSQIACGAFHTAAIRASDGSVWCWGSDSSGQLGDNTSGNSKSNPVSITNSASFSQIACGANFSAAIRGSDGSVWCWGSNSVGQLGDNTSGNSKSNPVSITNQASFSQIACGANFSAAIRASDGSVWCWGFNVNGQLGNNSTSNASNPVSITNSASFSQIACGASHSAAIRGSDGTVWCWGGGSSGQLGGNTTTDKSNPVSITNSDSFSQIACGYNHTVAIRGSDGTVWCWGVNGNGQLGDNTTTGKSNPVSVVGGYSFTKVACAASASYGLRYDGTIWAWGTNVNCQLGNGESNLNPVKIASTDSFSQIGTGSGNSFLGVIRASDGSVWCWGAGSSGQLGNNSTASAFNPVSINSTDSFSQIACGSGHTIALRGSDGSVWTWGSNTYGQLGNNSTANASNPVSINSTDSFSQIASSQLHMIAIRGSDGSVWCWGSNSVGQLGDNTSGNSKSNPVSITNQASFSRIAGGQTHTAAIRASDGSVWCWGFNVNGQLGNNSTSNASNPVSINSTDSFSQIACGNFHTVVIRGSYGSVWGWGYNSSGCLGNNSKTNVSNPVSINSTDSFSQIACGMAHTLAIRGSDGSIWSWGANNTGQLGDNSLSNSKSNPVSVVGGYSFTKVGCAASTSFGLRYDGLVFSWGTTTCLGRIVTYSTPTLMCKLPG